MKLKFDKGILDFFGSQGRAMKIGGLLLLGLFLIFVAGLSTAEPTVNEPTSDQRIAEMCSLMDGVGECRVMMTYHPGDESRVYAVLVLCEGAESPSVREKITSLFTSLYGIGSHRVEISLLRQ